MLNHELSKENLNDNRLKFRYDEVMKYQNLKAFEQALGSSKIYLVILPSDQERVELFCKFEKSYPQAQVEKFTAIDLDCRSLLDTLLSQSLFGNETLVFLDECEELKKKETEIISEFLEKNTLSSLLVLGSRGKTALLKGIEKIGIVLDMSEEKPWEKEKRSQETLCQIAKNDGKDLSPEAASLMIEKIGTDLPRLSQEIQKLICFVGDRKNIDRNDIFRLMANNIQQTPWQVAEQIIWEGGEPSFDMASFVPLIFSLRAQLQTGLKMANLIDARTPLSDWNPFFPKMWPKIMAKRRDQVMQKGTQYFKKGLESLYKIEALSRSGSVDPRNLYDFFRASLYQSGS